MTITQAFQLSNLLLVAFLLNVPLGYLRESCARYSVRWFVYIHLSIPIIVLLRMTYGFDWPVIPFTLGCAVVGQLLGGRMKRRRGR